MKRITVQATKQYDVVVGRNILKNSAELVKEVANPKNVCIITDDIVANLYLETVKNSFENAGFKTVSYIIKNGEASKSTENLVDIVEFMASANITRTDLVVALGGGVVGDISGFAAATYMRGIDYVQIPTTFLAAIDSSVGGKTAVNLKSGKNLFGAFHQPVMVICDVELLKTLERTTYLDGVAEAIKYGVLKDKKLIDLIDTDMEETIIKCVQIKRDIVSNDEFEHGERKFLNLGHTLGHAIESLSDFEITHGKAVAIGTVLAAKMGEKLGITKSGTALLLIEIMEHFGLPYECNYTEEELSRFAKGDKKREGDKIVLVIPECVGKCVLYTASVERLKDLIVL